MNKRRRQSVEAEASPPKRTKRRENEGGSKGSGSSNHNRANNVMPVPTQPPGPVEFRAPLPPAQPSTSKATGSKAKESTKKKSTDKEPTSDMIQSREIRAAIILAFQKDLEKLSPDNKSGEDSIEDSTLISNLHDCVDMWPKVFSTMRFPQCPEKEEDESKDWEIAVLAHWWFFGLTSLFFAAPDVQKSRVRESVKKLLKTLCQLLVNGQPSILDTCIPQFLSILRDLTLSDGNGTKRRMKVILPIQVKSKVANANSQITYAFEMDCDRDKWAIPHYLEAVSAIFPRCFTYNHQARHLLVEIVKRFSATLPLYSYGSVILSTLRNGLVPCLGNLTEAAVDDAIREILRLTSISPENTLEIYKLFRRCDFDSLDVLSGDGSKRLPVETLDLLNSAKFAELYANDDNQIITRSFRLLFKSVFQDERILSSEAGRATEMMRIELGQSEKLPNILHPLIERVIFKELPVAKLIPDLLNGGSSRNLVAEPVIFENSSELWRKVVKSWRKSLEAESTIIARRNHFELIDPPYTSLKFLESSSFLMKLACNLVERVNNKITCQVFNLDDVQKWIDIACSTIDNASEVCTSDSERRQLYSTILNTMEYMDSCSWFNSNLLPNSVNKLVCIAGWLWLSQFDSLPHSIRSEFNLTNYKTELKCLQTSNLLTAKMVRSLGLEIFRPWKQFVLEVYTFIMQEKATIKNQFLLVELLSAMADVSWIFKELPLKTTFSFLAKLVQSDIWRVDSVVRRKLGDALLGLPCICHYSFQRNQKVQNNANAPSHRSGCVPCSVKSGQESSLTNVESDVEQQFVQRIVALAAPILQSPFLLVKLRIVDLIVRCNNHMTSPSPTVALALLNVAVNGKPNLCEEIFRKFAVLLTENDASNLETGCPIRLEIAQKIFRVALPRACRNFQQTVKKNELPLRTRMKILLGIQALSKARPICLSVFLEVVYFMLEILSQTENATIEAPVVLLCQQILSGFAETQKCSPLELVTRIRGEISKQFLKIALRRFYNPSLEQDHILREQKLSECSSYIEMLKHIGSFKLKKVFMKYYYYALIEHIVPNLHSEDGYRFLLSAILKHWKLDGQENQDQPVGTRSIVIDTLTTWYPTLLLDHSSETINRCIQFLGRPPYGFNVVFVARHSEQKILNEMLCRFHDRTDRILRALGHLCNSTGGSSQQQVLSQGGNKPLTRTEFQELMDKRMLGFFLLFDTKMNSRIETVETKRNILKSFIALIKFMGKNKMGQLKTKTYQTLNSITELGVQFYDVLLEAWREFANNLDNESFSSMTCAILAALLPLRDSPPIRPQVDGLIAHFICFKKELTSMHHPKLYFLIGQCENREAAEAVGNAVFELRENNWLDYFNTIVKGAGDNNSRIRFLALSKLHDVLKFEFDKVQKFVLASGEQIVSPLISVLLDGLRSATGDKSDDAIKMRVLISNCLGTLGALDPVRFCSVDDDRYFRNRTCRGQAVTCDVNAFCVVYVQELLREFNNAKDATNFDYSVCLICNLIRGLDVQMIDSDPIWRKLSVGSRRMIEPMMDAKYSLETIETLPNFDCPLYLSDHGKDFDEWVVNWLTVLISCIKDETSSAYQLFVMNKLLLRKNARIAVFVIPYVAMHAILSATSTERLNIVLEMKYILKRWTVLDLEKRKAENSFLIKDSEGEVDIFEERRSIENESVFHFRCTQVVLAVLDSLFRTLRISKNRLVSIQTAQAKQQVSTLTPPDLTAEDMPIVESVLQEIPSTLISQVAFDSQSSTTALFYLEQELRKNFTEDKLQENLDYLQRIYLSLHDMDSVLGIAAVRKEEPSSHELVLENVALGNVTECMKSMENMAETDSSSLTVNYALVQAYLSVDEPGKAKDKISAILKERPEWEVAFQEVHMDSLLKLNSWSSLKKEVEKLEGFTGNVVLEEKSFTWNIALARIISKVESRQCELASEVVETLRSKLIGSLVAASEEMHPYKRAYNNVVQLHILEEIEDAIQLITRHTTPSAHSTLAKETKRLITKWDSRLINVNRSRKVLDQILNVRKSLLEIMKVTFQKNSRVCDMLSSSIRECWLDIATDSSRCSNFIRADKSLSKAKQFMSAKVLIQEAKILSRKGEKETAISVLQKGVQKYFPNLNTWTENAQPKYSSVETDDRILCSKALLLLAKLNEERKLLDKQQYINHYQKVVNVFCHSEKNLFELGSFFERLWTKEGEKNTYQYKIVKFYTESLRYGCKYVYQSLPRLLSIWFDLAAEGVDNVSITHVHKLIERLRDTVPTYVLMTAFSQLVSRLCHSHKQTWDLLKTIIAKIIRLHPFQTLWMTMAVLMSVNKTRQRRCEQIFKAVEAEKPGMEKMIKDYEGLTKKLRLLNDREIAKGKASLHQLGLDILPQHIKAMGNVIMPFQVFMNASLPQKGFSHQNHKPYPEAPVFITGIDDVIEVMTSLVRPKKITLLASNGRRYGLMVKPKDDLRKDSKIMEVNSVVNWYLRHNSESSQRQLHVRTYSVTPINEECGILEWVPNLMPLRSILINLYRERGVLGIRREQIKPNDPRPIKRSIFQEQYLDTHPPVLSEWFYSHFNDHQSWYSARMLYTRTAAVMSMVGYVNGLGDRHGDNILIDTVTGEVVHVDLNCLFCKGESFTVPEVVPFRLTQNILDGMGPLKQEGVFRRSCEVVLNMFREHQEVFLSVFRPFVYDPLVEWQPKQGKGSSRAASMETGELSNSTAVQTMNLIKRKLIGTARNLSHENDTELSVEAHVKYLISEAMSIDNLCEMYIGWSAHY